MGCEKIREEISLFIDDGLSGPDKERFESHVAACAECRQLLEETRKAITCVKKAEPVPLPLDFTIRLNQRLDRETARRENKKNIFTVFPWRIAAAALSLVIVVIAAKETMRRPSQMLTEPSGSLQVTRTAAPKKDVQAKPPVSFQKMEKRQKIAAAIPAIQEEKGAPKEAVEAVPGEITVPQETAEQVYGQGTNTMGEPPAINDPYSDMPAPGVSLRQIESAAPFAAADGTQNETPLHENEAVVADTLQKVQSTGFVATPAQKAPSPASARRSVPAAAGSSFIPIIRQWKGSWSNIRFPLQTVEKTAAGWQSLWRRHEDTPVPAIDFNRYMVAALFLGEKRSAGYSVTITRVERMYDRAVVWFREKAPSQTTGAAAALTQPYHIVVIKRVDGPVGFHREQ